MSGIGGPLVGPFGEPPQEPALGPDEDAGIGSVAVYSQSSTLSKSIFREEPSGATVPTAATTNGRSRLMWALMPSSRSPFAVTVLFFAASKA